MRKLLLLFLYLISAISVYSQKQNITFRHLTTDDGLSQFSVNSLYIDHQGLLWIGTREGLNRYNGNSIETFKLRKNDPNSLFSNTVLRITGDGQDYIYLLCTDGVAEFSLRTQKFRTLLQGSINAIYYKDKLYIGKKNEIFTYNQSTGNFDLFYRLPGKNTQLSAIHIDQDRTIWLGTTNSGVYLLDRKKQLSQIIKKGNITSIYEDSNQKTWIGSWEDGLYCIKKDKQIDHFLNDPSNANSISSNFVRSCCEDNNGNMWIGTFNGLNYYNPHTKAFHLYSTDNKAESLTHSSIWCIVKDEQGTLFLGTYFGGVNFFNPEYELYTRYKAGSSEREGLSSPIIGRMIEDQKGNLWVCTEGGGVNVYNKNERTFKWYKHIEGRNSISHNNVKAIYYDKHTDIMWIGTHLGGLNKLNLKTNHFTTYKMKEGDATTLPSDIVRDIIPYQTSLIIATENGICLFDPLTEKCEQLFKNLKEGHDIKMVSSIFLDNKGTLWISATGKGVYTYNFSTKKLKNYTHAPNNGQSLSNNNVNSITQDRYGNLWFSTSGSGLDLYHPESDTFENFDMQKNGLASDCIYKVCESSVQPHSLLLITNQGFSRFNYKQQQIYNYSKLNGFPLSAINENSLYVTRDKEVFLGGVDGMISFKEKSLDFSPKPYNILLSRLLVNGKEVMPGDESGILKESLSYTPAIHLKANQSMFSIEYTTSNFVLANRDEILYRLEGFSDEWHQSYQNQKIITYTNLNPGVYTLVIKTAKQNIKETKLIIHVLPPWYKTWWAYLIYTMATISLLVFLIRNYKAKIRLNESLKYEQKHIEDLETLNQSKLRFFTNISHEFRTPLTLIVGQIETLLQVQTFTPSIYSRILGIYKNSLQLRELITELLDFRKQEQGHMKIKVSRHNIVDFLYENYLIFMEYANSKQINFLFEKEAEQIEVWYDQKQMQKVVNNLLSNALKHTQPEDTILIRVSPKGSSVIIEINDTGSGIDTSEIDKIFDRFYQTERLDSLNTGAGTGIGLALTKGIIELHHGTISVTSELGKGSKFTITLKMGQAHFNEEQIIQENETLAQKPEESPSQIDLIPDLEIEQEAHKRIPDAKMLIVEDNEAIKEMLSSIFSTFYDVITASNGKEALNLVLQEMPNIVLSDVVMPEMSGTELCKQIKSDFNTCHIPVVLLTARTAVEHNIEGLKIGADDYITKPFNTNLLISRCNNLVNSRRLLQEKFSKQPQAFAQMLATNPMDKDMIDRAMTIIEQNLDNTDFNVNFFAREMGMARTNLFTKLKAITGQTPNDFILTIRLKKAAVMLRNNPELNITEISDKIGFSSPRYFSKCFKEIYHVSPLAYRKGEESAENEGNEQF